MRLAGIDKSVHERGFEKQLRAKTTPRREGDVFSASEYEELSILLIFACNKYKHERLPNLRCAVSDGKLIAKTFAPFGFRVVAELYDEQVTKASIERALFDLMKRYPLRSESGEINNRVGRLYIVFAGHGVPDRTLDDGSAFFCPYDFDPDKCVARLHSEFPRDPRRPSGNSRPGSS